MLPSPFRVVLDANVLYPSTVRDTLLRAAHAGFYQAFWTDEILREATSNLIERGLTSEQAKHLLEQMSTPLDQLLAGLEKTVPDLVAMARSQIGSD